MTGGAAVPGSWERFEAEGGAGIVGRGETLAEAFAQAAVAMFAAITDVAAVDARDVREVRAHAETLDALLVSWLAECLYVHDVEGFVASRAEVAAIDETPRVGGEPFRLHGVLHGEEIDPARHRGGTPVTGIVGRGASVARGPQGFEARAVLSASVSHK